MLRNQPERQIWKFKNISVTPAPPVTLCTRRADRSTARQPLSKLYLSLLQTAVAEAADTLARFQLFDSLTQSPNLLVLLLLEELQLLRTHAQIILTHKH